MGKAFNKISNISDYQPANNVHSDNTSSQASLSDILDLLNKAKSSDELIRSYDVLKPAERKEFMDNLSVLPDNIITLLSELREKTTNTLVRTAKVQKKSYKKSYDELIPLQRLALAMDIKNIRNKKIVNLLKRDPRMEEVLSAPPQPASNFAEIIKLPIKPIDNGGELEIAFSNEDQDAQDKLNKEDYKKLYDNMEDKQKLILAENLIDLPSKSIAALLILDSKPKIRKVVAKTFGLSDFLEKLTSKEDGFSSKESRFLDELMFSSKMSNEIIIEMAKWAEPDTCYNILGAHAIVGNLENDQNIKQNHKKLQTILAKRNNTEGDSLYNNKDIEAYLKAESKIPYY